MWKIFLWNLHKYCRDLGDKCVSSTSDINLGQLVMVLKRDSGTFCDRLLQSLKLKSIYDVAGCVFLKKIFDTSELVT